MAAMLSWEQYAYHVALRHTKVRSQRFLSPSNNTFSN